MEYVILDFEVIPPPDAGGGTTPIRLGRTKVDATSPVGMMFAAPSARMVQLTRDNGAVTIWTRSAPDEEAG